MTIILKTGKDVKKALKVLDKEFDKKELSQKETIEILANQGFKELAQTVENMEPQEFEDWVLNHFL